jgi:hypothetical protein
LTSHLDPGAHCVIAGSQFTFPAPFAAPFPLEIQQRQTKSTSDFALSVIDEAMGSGVVTGYSVRLLLVTNTTGQSTAGEGLNKSGTPTWPEFIEHLERLIPNLEALLPEMENLRFYLVSSQVTVDELQAHGDRFVISKQLRAELEKSLTIMIEQEGWLRHLKHLLERERALAKAYHNGKAGSLLAWIGRENFDRNSVGPCILEFADSIPALMKRTADLETTATQVAGEDAASTKISDTSDKDWELMW